MTTLSSTHISTDVRIAFAISVFFTALFTGTLYTCQQAIVPALLPLDASTYIRVQQGLLDHWDGGPTNISLVGAVATVVPIYVLVRTRAERKTMFWRLMLVSWLFFAVGVSVFTMVLNVPINEAVKGMDPSAPPADWAALRDRWNLLNEIRSYLNYASLAGFLLAACIPSADLPEK